MTGLLIYIFGVYFSLTKGSDLKTPARIAALKSLLWPISVPVRVGELLVKGEW